METIKYRITETTFVTGRKSYCAEYCGEIDKKTGEIQKNWKNVPDYLKFDEPLTIGSLERAEKILNMDKERRLYHHNNIRVMNEQIIRTDEIILE